MMQPIACVNCNKTLWQQGNELYCRRCTKTANKLSRIITRNRKEREATEQLDIETLSQLRKHI